MNILLKHILKNIWENKFRSIIIILVVMLSVFVTFTALSLQDIVTDTYNKTFNGSAGQADITITKGNGRELYSKGDINLHEIAVEKRSDIIDVSGKYTFNNNPIKAIIIGMDIDEYMDMDSVGMLDNTNKVKLGSKECIISQRSAKKYGLSKGDTISVDVKENIYKYTIAEIAKSDRTFYEEKGNFQILLNVSDVNEIIKSNNKISKTRIKLKEGYNVQDSITKIKEQNSGLKVLQGEELDSMHTSITQINTAMLVVIVIVVLIGSYILSSLVKIIMYERIPNVGIFRSIGADKGKITKLLLIEFLSYGIIGTIIGINIAFTSLPMVADLFNKYKEFGVSTQVQFRYIYIIIAVCVGLFLPSIVSLFKIKKVASKPLKNIILKTESDSSKESKKSTVLAFILIIMSIALYIFNQKDNVTIGFLTIISFIVGLGLLMRFILSMFSKLCEYILQNFISGSSLLGIKNLSTNKTLRGNTTMIVIIIPIIILITTMVNSIGAFAVSSTVIFNHDIIVLPKGDKSVDARELKSFEGIDNTRDSYEAIVSGSFNKEKAPVMVYGIESFDEIKSFITGFEYDGYNFDEKLRSVSNGIVIDKYQKKVFELNLGDTVALYHDTEHNNKIGDFTIVGFWDSSKVTTDRAAAAINKETYQKLINFVPSRVQVRTTAYNDFMSKSDKKDFSRLSIDDFLLMKPLNDSIQISNNIAKQYIDTEINAMTFYDFVMEQVDTINTIFKIMIFSVVLGGFIVMLGISSNLIVSFIQRKKEFACLYSICMSKKQLINMLLWETISSYIAIFITSWISSLVLIKFLPKMLNRVGLAIPYQLDTKFLLVVLLFAFFILLGTAIFPIMKLKKINIVEELKYE